MSDQEMESTANLETGGQAEALQLQYALEQLRSQQNLPLGALLGLVASLAGAGIWAGITVVTGYQIGWMAVGVGFLVGIAVKIGGKGIEPTFGVIGAVMALFGCLLGNLLAVCGFIAQQESMAFLEVVSRLDFALVQNIMIDTFAPMDLLFYGIALYEGFTLSFDRIGEG